VVRVTHMIQDLRPLAPMVKEWLAPYVVASGLKDVLLGFNMSNEDKNELPKELQELQDQVTEGIQEMKEELEGSTADDIEEAKNQADAYIASIDGVAKGLGYKDREELLELLKQRDFRGVPADHMVGPEQRFTTIANRSTYKQRRHPSKRKNK